MYLSGSPLPEHLIRNPLTVEKDRGDFRHLPHPWAVGVVDSPVLEDAVPAGGELAGDRLHRVESAVLVDDVIGLEFAEHDRVFGIGSSGLPAAAEQDRP
jgi:hypothetical protein